MKKISVIIFTLVVLLGASGLRAQHYVGVRGGYGGGTGRFYPANTGMRQDQKMTFGFLSGGVMWKYYGEQRYVGGVGAEVEFLQRGFEFHMYSRDSDTTYRRTVNTINIPLIWQPHLNMIGNRLRVFLNLGIFVSYNFSSTEYLLMKGEGVIFKRPYEMKLNRDNPFGFGLQGGFGFNVVFGKIEFMAEARYYFSYGDLYRNRAKYYGYEDDIFQSGRTASPNQFVNPIRSPVDNFNVSVGFFYRIGDKPHEVPPGPKAIARRQNRMAEKEAKQQQKSQKKNGKHKAAESSETDTEGHQRDIQQGDDRPLPGGDGDGNGGEGES